MFRKIEIASLVAGVMIAATGFAQTPASAPAGSTGLCRDGSYWTGATKKGACHGHKGVQDWYAGTAATPASATVGPAAPAIAAPKTNTAPAPGGDAGQVWVNKTSKVYHCPSDRWYGKTKNGAYMTEADAIAQGNHADHGKACK
jgi:hypothetical protein